MTYRIHEDTFRRILRENIKPAQPIDDVQLLKGREPKLREIDRAFNSPGMHIFIFGDRGVGKTSLALTAATQKHPSSSEPPHILCDHKSSFSDLMADMIYQLAQSRSVGSHTKKCEEVGGSLYGFLTWKRTIQTEPESGKSQPIRTVNEAIQLMAEAITLRGETEPVVVLDEFDRLSDITDKKLFGEFIKGVHDKRLPMRFIFCGVGTSLDELTGGHLSSTRPLWPVELQGLTHDARWAIVDNAASKLGIAVDRGFVIRIGQISDGFPYYVHLIAQNLFWTFFERVNTQPHAESHITSADFQEAVRESIEKSESPLKAAYNLAIQKTKNSRDYEEILWAIADHAHFERQFNSIYEQSYLSIVEECIRKERAAEGKARRPLDKEQFRMRLYRLNDAAHGRIILRSKNGWFKFRENVVRGYVRLRAEREGIQLGRDHF